MGTTTTGLGTAPGYPNYSGNYIPEIWSTKLQVKFYAATALTDIANTDYEGDITAQGDKVYIRTTPDFTIGDYKKGQNLDYEVPDSPSIELLIDKGKYYAFVTDVVDINRADVKLIDNFSQGAANDLRTAIETDVWASIPAEADSANQGATAGAVSGNIDLGTTGSPLALTAGNIVETLIDAGTVLDEQNVPDDGRYVILPSKLCGTIKKSDLGQVDVSGDAQSIRRNGRVGMIDRFTVYRSNILSQDAGKFSCLFGQKTALTFASALTEHDSLKSETTFGYKNRGLQVYGYKVVKPESLGVIVATI